IKVRLSRDAARPEYLRLELKSRNPVPVGFRTFYRTNDTEFAGPLVAMNAPGGEFPKVSRVPALRPETDKLDVIFHADPAAAAQTVDIFEIWDGELVFKDVPIEQSK
ncbi:MAG: hypothetical protein ACREJC_21680, partial [Tepidisphaeraceae bacterium]